MCRISQDSQRLKDELLNLIDADTEAFNHVLDAYRLPQDTLEHVSLRNKMINDAMKEASNIPFRTLQCCREVMNYAKEVAESGNPNSITDAGVSAEMANAGAHGAALNVKINLNDIDDIKFCQKMKKQTDELVEETDQALLVVREIVLKKLNSE